jgi:carbonic anhydrase
MTIAIIGCMDRRLNGFFEELRDKSVRENPGERVYIVRGYRCGGENPLRAEC